MFTLIISVVENSHNFAGMWEMCDHNQEHVSFKWKPQLSVKLTMEKDKLLTVSYSSFVSPIWIIHVIRYMLKALFYFVVKMCLMCELSY